MVVQKNNQPIRHQKKERRSKRPKKERKLKRKKRRRNRKQKHQRKLLSSKIHSLKVLIKWLKIQEILLFKDQISASHLPQLSMIKINVFIPITHQTNQEEIQNAHLHQ